MAKNRFDIVILNGRPAAGKSEIIDYLKRIPIAERLQRFHIGEFDEIDDFPILWERFEDDNIYEKLGKGRFFTDSEFTFEGKTYPGFTFKEKYFWNYLIEKLSLQYAKTIRDNKNYHENRTTIVEFARGTEHGGFRTAYDYLSDELLKRAVTVYIKVSWEESLRKNRRRFNPNKPDSILEHALEDKKIEMLYKRSDWDDFSGGDPDYLHVKNLKIPYGVFDNEPEKTDKPDILGKHLEEVCGKLWKLYNR
jgi:hypothetical protein